MPKAFSDFSTKRAPELGIFSPIRAFLTVRQTRARRDLQRKRRSARGTLSALTPIVSRRSNHVAPVGLTGTARHYIGDLVYGANDGLVTTFAAVAAVEGGSLAPAIVLIIGIANLAADGLSMGIGNFLSIRAREQAREADDLPEEESQPARHGMATFLSFVIVGAVPLLPYVIVMGKGGRVWGATALTFLALFAVGAVRGLVTKRRWWRTGLEVLLLGALAGAVAFGMGAVVAAIARVP